MREALIKKRIKCRGPQFNMDPIPINCERNYDTIYDTIKSIADNKILSSPMSKKSILLIIILLVIAGSIFYWWWAKPFDGSGPLFENTEPPTLFAKEDYKIEERADATYIVVDKVGLTAKVPTGWRVELEGDDFPEPEYWVNLYSPDAELQHNLLAKGCGISITAGTEQKNNQETQRDIDFIQKNPGKDDEIREGFKFEVIKINNHQALKWIAPEKPIIGQTIGLDIPIDDIKLIDLTTSFPFGEQKKCEPIWNEFLENVEIK